MPGRDDYLLSVHSLDSYLLADHTFVVKRLVDVEAAMERCRTERDQAVAALYFVRRWLDEGVAWEPFDPARGQRLDDLIAAVLDVVSGRHPSAYRPD